jgi:uncharacterized protein (DUF433 family)
MPDWQSGPYQEDQCVVAAPELLGGKLAIPGTRLSVKPILECLSTGMTLSEIGQAFPAMSPHAALPEVPKPTTVFEFPKEPASASR